MTAARMLREARRTAGLTQRALAARAGTSQAAVADYEAGRKVPGVTTLERLLGACGAELRMARVPGGRTRADLAEAGRRLVEVMGLAAALPSRPPGPIGFPPFPGR
jgi:transcriptional regulator with XRE-family HTH domain